MVDDPQTKALQEREEALKAREKEIADRELQVKAERQQIADSAAEIFAKAQQESSIITEKARHEADEIYKKALEGISEPLSKERESIIAQANSRAEEILASAEARAKQVFADAQARANELVRQNEKRAEEIQKRESSIASKEQDIYQREHDIDLSLHESYVSQKDSLTRNLQQQREAAEQEAKQLRENAIAAADKILANAKTQQAEILKAGQAKIDADSKSLKEKEAHLADREQGLDMRENSLLRETSERMEKERAFLQNKIESLKQEIDALEQQKANKSAQVDADVGKYYKDQLEAASNEIAKERDRLLKENEAIRSENEKLLEKENELFNLETKLRLKADDLNKKERILDERENALEDEVHQRMSVNEKSAIDKYEESRKALNELNGTLKEALEENTKLKLRFTAVVNAKEGLINCQEEAEKYKKAYADAKNQLAEANDRLSKFSKFENANVLANRAESFESLTQKNEELNTEVDNLKAELARRSKCDQTLAIAQESLVKKQEECDALREDLNRRTSPSRDDRIAPIVRHYKDFDFFDNEESFQEVMGENAGEIQWLDYVAKKTAESGIIFPRRLLNAYHTSVKIREWSPMVVLAGVSGTGKSELPKQYALHGGMAFLPIAVKPDWDSPSSLFGFYNSIENKFQPTELLRALYAMQELGSAASNGVLMVLLDEMNLAHVELYFSDLLSKFETSRFDESGAIIDVDLGAGIDPLDISIGSNVLWTGTMNEDETTKALSDKVLDRSTLITFPRPTTLISRKRVSDVNREFYLPKSLWNQWIRDGLDNEEIDASTMASLKAIVERINNQMSEMGRNLGHRVWQGIQNYICNHPDVINAVRSKKNADAPISRAFTEAVAFKIMPKLRGLETKGEYARYLDEINKIIKNDIPDLAEDFAKARSLPTNIFQWCSAKFFEAEETPKENQEEQISERVEA